MNERSWGRRAMLAGVGVYARFDRLVRVGRNAALSVARGLLDEALTKVEKEELSVYLYAVDGRPAGSADTLFPWERTWFAETLPASPARILIGAAGAGREAAALVANGYSVDAFEPVESAAAQCRSQMAGQGSVELGTYADLCAAVHTGESNALSGFARARYDAVLLGWRSLSHLLDLRDASRLLLACTTLAPRGPILGSFSARCLGAPVPLPERLARHAGFVVRRARRLGEHSTKLEFLPHAGFVRTYSEQDLLTLASECGRSVVYDFDDVCAHATFLERHPR